jgi:ribulose-phosphate 3-epimerase
MSSSHQVRIAASILAADFSRLGQQVREAEGAGSDMIHIDVMDGHFVPNITVGPMIVRAVRSVTDLPLHVHLMIEQPERYIDDFVRAGADLVTVHVETCPHLHRTIQQIREAGARPGVTLNPATPLGAIDEVLDQVDAVLVMTVNPGFGGQQLIPSTLRKVRRLRELLDQRGLSCLIEVDGGVNVSNISQIAAAGADVLVMGAAVFASEEGVQASLQRLREALQ